MCKLLHDSPNITETTGCVVNKLLLGHLKINSPLRIVWQDMYVLNKLLIDDPKNKHPSKNIV